MHRKESFALEDSLRGKMRVFTKFQVNLVIPKGYLWLFFNQREGICI